MTENAHPRPYAIDPMSGKLPSTDFTAMFDRITLSPVEIAGMNEYGFGAAIPTILWRAQELVGKHEADSPEHAWEMFPLNSLWIEPRFGLFRRYRVIYSAPNGRSVVLPLRGHGREFSRYKQWQMENPSLALIFKPGVTKRLQNLFGADR